MEQYYNYVKISFCEENVSSMCDEFCKPLLFGSINGLFSL